MASFAEFSARAMQFADDPGMEAGLLLSCQPGFVEVTDPVTPMLFFRAVSGPNGVVTVHRCAPLPVTTDPPNQATEYRTDHPDETALQVWQLMRDHFSAHRRTR